MNLFVEYKRHNYVHTHVHMIIFLHIQEPKKIILGTKRIYHGHGRKRRLVKVTDTLVYVPLLQTIEILLKDEGIYTKVCYHMLL